VRLIEEKLRAVDMIEHAECYKTQSGHVCINIRQRIPVVRVMAENGDDYYVDNNGGTLRPKGFNSDVIVATGFISRSYAQKRLAKLANEIQADPFWKNQVVQLNVLDDGSVEIVPRVGEHIAYIGQPVGVARKLDRLAKFYRYGLSHAGWNRYSRISVEFDNQIICKRRKVKKV
jgi:cell division protein FtsQ